MRRWVLALVVALGALASPSTLHAQAIVAVVNDAVVTDLEVAERLRLALALVGQSPTAANAEQWRPQVLRTLVDERLQVQEARRLGIVVSEEQVDAALGEVASRNGRSADALLEQFRSVGVHGATLRRQLEAQIAWIEVVRRQLAPRAVISDAQVEQPIDRIAQGEREVRLGELFLPIYAPDQEPRVLQDAQRLRQSIQAGADFAGLAQQFSAAPSADRGGDLGWVPISRLPEDLAALIAGLPDGGVSQPIRSPEGVYLFRRLGLRGGGEVGVVDDATREQVERRLRQEAIDRLAARYLRNLRQDAFIELRS